VVVDGVECFLYNRTPAYDEIVQRMMKHEAQSDGEKLSFNNGASVKHDENGHGGANGLRAESSNDSDCALTKHC
jgi:hypothetical protein